MRLFLVALVTGAAVAAALPGVAALTRAVADDWIATDRPMPLTQSPADAAKSEAAAKRSAKKEAVAAPIQFEAQAALPAPAPSPSTDEPANGTDGKR